MGAPDLDRRAAHRSCTTGEPGTTFFLLTFLLLSHSVSADVALIDQMVLLASLYDALNESNSHFCGNLYLFMSRISTITSFCAEGDVTDRGGSSVSILCPQFHRGHLASVRPTGGPTLRRLCFEAQPSKSKSSQKEDKTRVQSSVVAAAI